MSRVDIPVEFAALYDAQFLEALDAEPPVSIRLNPNKPFDCQWQDPVLWCAQGRYLTTRPLFTLDARFAAGAYYVQEAGSMFLGHILEQLPSIHSARVLDLCAAPGGKSTHIESIVGIGGMVVSNEIIRSRAGILTQNIQKWGAGNAVVCSSDASLFGSALPSMFDVLVIDAPCSGEGMFRKDDTARSEWKPQNVEHCAARARRIMSDSWDSLRDGGYMIFSTCTFNRIENEENVLWAARELGAQIIPIENLPQGIIQTDAGCRFSPDRVRAEGFFIALMRKTSAAPPARRIKLDTKKLITSTRYTLDPLIEVERDNRLYGYSEPVWAMVQTLRNARIQMLDAGVEIGEVMHGKLKPAHALALYHNVRRDAFLATELSHPDAIEYLRKNNVAPELLHQGLQMITHNNLPLGFAKRIDGRVNNLYPTAWRILMQ